MIDADPPFPPHPGEYIRQSVLPPGLTVTAAAKLLGVGRPALSNLLNGNAALSPEMAVRFQKAFGANSDELMKLQTAYEQAVTRKREPEIAVRAYAPSFLDIKAMQIEAWADRMEARAEFGAFMRRLVTSTASKLSNVDFPAYENSQRKGWDGFVISDSMTPWIPLGQSGWEFGCNQSPSVKAEDDYLARLRSVKPDVRKAMTFVFVTPRRWIGKDDWAAAKRGLREWHDVRAYDVSDLEQWLEQSIPAQAWMAERLPVSDGDVQSLERCWKLWADVTTPNLSKELFSRWCTWNVGKLHDWLQRSPNHPFTVVADSAEEALAFLACLFDTEPLTKMGDRAVVVRSAAALAKVANTSNSFIAIVVSPDAERESAGIHKQQHTIIVTSRNAIEGEPDVALDLVDDETFRCSLECMGLGDDDVDRLRRESGHSLTVLRRRLAEIPAIKAPPWASQKDVAERLIPLVFIGAWDSVSDADQAVLADIAAGTRETIEKTVAELVGSEQSPVWSIGRFRGVVSKVDSFYAVQRLITRDELERFFRVARVVLSEVDPALELPEDKRWASNLYGKSRKHSSALRRGLCETLVLLAVHGNNLFQTRLGFDVEGQVNALIRTLLTPLDAQTWQSQQDDLPNYAEAAPDVFLDILEEDLAANDPKVFALMQPAGSGMFSSCSRSGLLWALENLAWSPRRLPRVVLILSKLSTITINDNWVNKPENTLEAIFRSWVPQTAAGINERIAALELLVKRNPEIGWRICVNQFDPQARIGHYSHRPRWRNDAAGAGRPLENNEPFVMASKAFDLAICWPTHNARTLGDLVDRLHGIPPAKQGVVWKAIEKWANSNPDDGHKAELRERIRVRTMTHRGRKDQWAPRTSKTAKAAYQMLLPKDLVLRHQWLFAKQWVEESADELAEVDLDFRKRDERIAALRSVALSEIWAKSGYDGVVSLCTLGEAAGVVGWHLANEVFDEEQLLGFVHMLLSDQAEASRSARNSCMSGLLGRLELPKRIQVLSRTLTALGDQPGRTEQTLCLLRNAPFDGVTWAFVDALSKNEQRAYWSNVAPFWGHYTQPEVNRIVDELLNVDRPRAAFRAVEMELQNLESDRLFRLLFDIATKQTEPEGRSRLASHHISKAFEVLSSKGEISGDELARLEFLYIGALNRTKHGIRNLERQLSESPELFVQALALAFQRNDDGQDPPEWHPGNDESSEALAASAYQLLTNAKRIPGAQDDGSVNGARLRDWMSRARTLCGEHARQAVGDSLIGQLLAKSPAGSDGIWPCEAVRDVLEDFGTSEIARGASVGIYNSRGAIWRGEGGGQERELSAKYRGWSRSLANHYPWVGRMLDGIADMYDRDAAREDNETAIRKRLWH